MPGVGFILCPDRFLEHRTRVEVHVTWEGMTKVQKCLTGCDGKERCAMVLRSKAGDFCGAFAFFFA
jgi:hypothetical protein